MPQNAYEIYAIRYGTWRTRRSEQFYRYDVYGEPDAVTDMDYYFWLLRGERETVLVDTGYHPSAIAGRPGRVCLADPVAALGKLGVEPGDVDRIVVSHFHFDHIGNLARFPDARLSVQRREFDFWTGPHGGCPAASASVERGEVDYIRRASDLGQVDWLDGHGRITEGVNALLVGGHCPGQQIVVVEGARPVVLASDALHFYEEMERMMPFQVFTDLVGVFATYDVLRGLAADRDAVIVAGHDPRVMREFPPADGSDPDLAVRIA